MNSIRVKGLGVLAVGAAMLCSSGANAGGGAGSQFLGADFSYNGFIRFEGAYSTDSQQQQVNQFGDLANGVAIPRTPGDPFTNYTTVLVPGAPGAIGTILGTVQGQLGGTALGPTKGVSNLNGINDTFTRYVPKEGNTFNYHIMRLEFSPTLSWGNFALISRFRAIYEPSGFGYADFNYEDYSNINGGITGGETQQFHSKPSFLGYEVRGNNHPIIFERAGTNYQIDAPALFLQYNYGATTIRIGNQTVAWGQLLFFRLFDTANGLDLRRHFIENRALEEYADVRESAPGIRITSQVTDQITVDTFAQQFIPSVLGNVNTPYNLVPSQFTVHDNYSANGSNRDVNFGMRVRGEFGNFSLQAMATHRYNPLGAIRWTQSGVNKSLPNDNALGLAFNQYCNTVLGTGGAGCGPILAKTPFEVAPAGVFTAEEWFNYAGYIKLSGLDGLDKAVDDFPASQQLLARDIGRDPNAAANELSAFFSAGEGLRGHIERDYYSENVFGLGGSFVTEAEPGSIFDQAILNLETTYTPKRVFTSIDLGHNFDRKQEIQVGFSTEKYQRFSNSFPATYLVFQYLWQQNSDLAGLRLNGYGSENYSKNGIVLDSHIPTSENPKINPGIKPGANYVVLAALQPFPNYIYELSIATLIDVQGGVLVQPGLQWKPRGNVTVNLFYNYVQDNAWGNNPNKNIVHLFADTNEAAIRLGFQF